MGEMRVSVFTGRQTAPLIHSRPATFSTPPADPGGFDRDGDPTVQEMVSDAIVQRPTKGAARGNVARDAAGRQPGVRPVRSVSADRSTVRTSRSTTVRPGAATNGCPVVR